MDFKNKDISLKDNYYLLLTENIEYQKVEVCKEFMIDFTKLFIDSFLGHDAFENQGEIDNYIKWCYNKTCQEYKNIYNFDFTNNNKLYFYILTYSNEIISKDIDLNVLYFKLIKVIKERFFLYKEKSDIKEFLNLYFIFYKNI
jgi:hypothetical protein